MILDLLGFMHTIMRAATDKNLIKAFFRSLRIRGIRRTVALAALRANPTSLYLYDQAFKRAQNSRNLEELRTEVKQWDYQPLVSIVMPVYKVDPKYLTRAIDSVANQIYQNWELCICDDASNRPDINRVLSKYRARDNRIKVVFSQKNGGISQATNQAMDLANGEYVGFLDHDDELTDDALFFIVKELNSKKWDVVYSDEDKIDKKGRLRDPFCKPDWSPELLYAHNYITHFSVYKRVIVERVGRLRSAYDGSQDYDLILRVSSVTNSIGHVARVLYHWRTLSTSTAGDSNAKLYAYDNAVKALQYHFDNSEPGTIVTRGSLLGYYRVKFPLATYPLVSIIIPVRDKIRYLIACLESIWKVTDYPNYEIIVVNNGSIEPDSLEYLEYLRQQGHTVIDRPGPFNYSHLNNIGVRAARGQVLAFLNSDVEVISSGWLSEMVSYNLRREIGCVGAKLYYPDGKIQHAGVVLGLGGLAAHSHRNFHKDDYGYFGTLISTRNYSAVTGACLTVRRDIFEQVEGFDEINLPVNYNDVDFCLKVLNVGYRNVVTPYATLYHMESATRVPKILNDETVYMQTRWEGFIRNDPYYNRQLTRAREDFSYDTDTLSAVSSMLHRSEKLVITLFDDILPEETIPSEQLGAALQALWHVYHARNDLRNTYRIGEAGALEGLVHWADMFGCTLDSAAPHLESHRQTFRILRELLSVSGELSAAISQRFG